jgi:hypothetical protein
MSLARELSEYVRACFSGLLLVGKFENIVAVGPGNSAEFFE